MHIRLLEALWQAGSLFFSCSSLRFFPALEADGEWLSKCFPGRLCLQTLAAMIFWAMLWPALLKQVT